MTPIGSRVNIKRKSFSLVENRKFEPIAYLGI